jgi:flavin-binding protein dodecin
MAKKAEATNSVYKLVEVIGTSTQSWEDAAKNAVERRWLYLTPVVLVCCTDGMSEERQLADGCISARRTAR